MGRSTDRVPQRYIGGVGRFVVGGSPIGTFKPKPADKDVVLNNRPNEGAKK